MFEKTALLFIYVETPLHAGTGRGLGAVDLPIQRERTTQYPMIQASSLKGKLRAEIRERNGWSDTSEEIIALFGKAGESGESFAGAVAPGDARILLFPVRSLVGVTAWTTSCHVLQRLVRDCAAANVQPPPLPSKAPTGEKALVVGNALSVNNQVVLEDFSFAADASQSSALTQLATWIAERALLEGEDYNFWRDQIKQKLVVLHEDAFRDFVLYATEIQTHVRLDPAKKTVQTGALWTTEALPSDTLLYAPLMVSASRVEDRKNGQPGKPKWSADEVLNTLRSVLDGKRIQLGGDETTGQGWVTTRLLLPQEVHKQ
ncbi:MAG: type III-B CRISPR module RAMP protein Cmr4 [Thermoflexales bacterium]|nr:type III-B CRISPR module RAMP protein Cmr4 [Thermoflexales bacterium]